MKFRKLLDSDSLEEVGAVYELSWKFAYKGIVPQEFLDTISFTNWTHKLNDTGRHNVVAVDGGRVVGTSCVCRSRWREYPEYGEVMSLYLLPEYVGKGYGAELLKCAVTELHEMGFRDILLWVLEDNGRARRFYERNGFTCTGSVRRDSIGGKELNEILYINSKFGG